MPTASAPHLPSLHFFFLLLVVTTVGSVSVSDSSLPSKAPKQALAFSTSAFQSNEIASHPSQSSIFKNFLRDRTEKIRRRKTMLRQQQPFHYPYILAALFVPFTFWIGFQERTLRGYQSQNCFRNVDDDDAMMLYFLSADGPTEVFSRSLSRIDTLEVFLRSSLFLAVLLFLYTAILLQHSVFMLGMKRCRRKIDAWKQIATFSSRRHSIKTSQ
jgi:hypothetical protein